MITNFGEKSGPKLRRHSCHVTTSLWTKNHTPMWLILERVYLLFGFSSFVPSTHPSVASTGLFPIVRKFEFIPVQESTAKITKKLITGSKTDKPQIYDLVLIMSHYNCPLLRTVSPTITPEIKSCPRDYGWMIEKCSGENYR